MSRRVGALKLVGASIGFAALLHGQVCRLSVAGLNQSRRVMGPVHAECPDEVVHTAPFGNWGVTSNYGQKGDSHQFDGWCHDTRTCSNSGSCQISCTNGWYEWNSCTDDALFRPPNCSSIIRIWAILLQIIKALKLPLQMVQNRFYFLTTI